MLVCRIPYFTTLLTSDFAFTDKSSELSLDVCSSDIFKRILNFVWEGEILLSDMSLSSVFNLLETARFLCIDILVDGILEFIKQQVQSKNIDFGSSLDALEFSISHKFPKMSDMILGLIEQNVEEISSMPKFKTLSTTSVMALLNRKKNRVSSEVVVFKALLKWLEDNGDISEVMREEMANAFDLENFSN